MSAQVTEAHRALARCIGRGNVGEYPQDVEHDAQLIAESEANATAELRLDRYRAVKGRHEAEHERDQLRAEVEQLRDGLRDSEAALALNTLCAERAEAKLNESRYETVKAAQEGLRECIRAERAEAELALLKPKYERHCREYNDKLAELRYAENMQRQSEAELAKERARLDWLEANSASLYCAGLYDGTNAAVCVPNGKDHKGATIRAAIDAAINPLTRQ